VRNRSGLYPRLAVDGEGKKVVSGAGGVLLTRTVATVGPDSALSAALSPWRRPTARHDPGKVLLDALAAGGGSETRCRCARAPPRAAWGTLSDSSKAAVLHKCNAEVATHVHHNHRPRTCPIPNTPRPTPGRHMPRALGDGNASQLPRLYRPPATLTGSRVAGDCGRLHRRT
jgi:predicted Fe-S protein YdhL (DUF1289 family)